LLFTIMHYRFSFLLIFLILIFSANAAIATTSTSDDVMVVKADSVSSPISPEYVINDDKSVTLRLCFNWSCARRQTMTFTPSEIDLVKKRMATCSGSSLHDRLQRIRIGIWQMELLAEKYQPLLANDLSRNEFEEDIVGRTDCVDNSSNTTTYLEILRDIGELPGWTVSSPQVRNRFLFHLVHWSAVVIDNDNNHPWTVDSWYRPNGHLPMVMPLQDWIDEKEAWKPPFEELNVVPPSIQGLCSESKT